jgi:glycosyltransferase involved in cell wall biosynthesis/putative flippase GtrA
MANNDGSGARHIGSVVGMAGRFALVGAVCAVLNIAIMYTGTVLVGVNYLTSALLTCAITIPLSYFFHRRFTFRILGSWRGELSEFLRFVFTQLTQFGAGLSVLVALVEWVKMTPMWATVLMTALMFGYGFIVNSTWVFHKIKSGSERSQFDKSNCVGQLRLLQVSAFFPKHGGGIEVVADRIARGISKAGMLVHWMAGGKRDERPDHVDARMTIDQARSIDFLEESFGVPSPIWSLGSIKRLWLAVRFCDLLHVHDFLYMPTLTAMIFAGILRKPVVLTQHIGPIEYRSRIASGILLLLHRSIGACAMRLASQVIFVGRPVLKYFEEFASFRRPPILIANGLDHSMYHPPANRVTASGPMRCLFVGRFVEKKGLALLKQCMDLPDLQWVFIGWGPMSPNNWAPLPGHVEVLGNLRADEIVPYYQSADLLVLPSTGEGFPLVIQEALACGTPVLVSAEVAKGFAVIDEKCVFAVELDGRNAATALRERLRELSRQRSIIAEARTGAANLAQQWSWDDCVGRYFEMYRIVIGDQYCPVNLDGKRKN